MVKCEHCDKEFSSYEAAKQHYSAKHPNGAFNPSPPSVPKSSHRHKSRRRPRNSRNLKPLILVILIIVAAGSLGYLALASSFARLSNPHASEWTGRQAPDFTLSSINGSTFNLKEYQGKSNVLLFFHEGLGCSPCLQQIQALNTDYQNFKALNITVVAISTDPQSSLAQWARASGIGNVIVLSDQNLQVDTTYQTLGSDVSMMPGGMAGHTFILVNGSGTVIWRADYGPGTMYVDDSTILQNVRSALSSSK